MQSVYVETSIASYLTARPGRDLRATAWQQTTVQWWEQERTRYQIFTSELTLVEAQAGDASAADRRRAVLDALPLLSVSDEARALAHRLVAGGGVPTHAAADALHIAVAAAHGMDYLLTWNCRHINNAVTRPVIRVLCTIAGYTCPEICTPLELLSDEAEDAQR